jgi:hypothetical protein
MNFVCFYVIFDTIIVRQGKEEWQLKPNEEVRF